MLTSFVTRVYPVLYNILLTVLIPNRHAGRAIPTSMLYIEEQASLEQLHHIYDIRASPRNSHILFPKIWYLSTLKLV